MKAGEALEQARELVKNGWCQMSAAETGDGRECYAASENAASFCISGAVMRATWPWNPEEETTDLWALTEECFDLLCQAVREKGWDMSEHTPWQVINDWNDEPNRSKEDVVGLYNRAIELAQEA